MCISILLLVAVALSAVEEGPFPVLKVIDGDTIELERQGKAERVRLLYVDTPESIDNDHGKEMPEGKAAAILLGLMLGDPASVRLWSPGDRLKRDRYDRILACCIPEGWAKEPGQAPETASLQVALVRHGLSAYWRKYGEAPEPLHSVLLKAQASAEENKKGAWETAPDWMRDKANERTAPKVQP